MKIKAFIYHKRAEKYNDCQDWFGINFQTKRIAISDGMSQSIFPQWWARILVDYYLEKGYFPQDIRPLQEKWQRMLQDEIQRREEEALTNPKRDPWRLKNLLAEKSGAGATLCGLTVEDNEWICECLGDSCVITINHDYTLNIYSSQVGEFSNHPDYFDSFEKGRGKPIRKRVNRDVKAVLIVTDPFAEFFQLNENNLDFIKLRFEELQKLSTHESFLELVERWRDEFGMHNDDSTLVLIEDVSNSEFTVVYQDNLTDLCATETNSKTQHTSQSISQERGVLETKVSSDITNRSEKNYQVQTFEEAKKQFIVAAELMLSFCPDNKRVNKGSIRKWLFDSLTQTIKKFKRK